MDDGGRLGRGENGPQPQLISKNWKRERERMFGLYKLGPHSIIFASSNGALYDLKTIFSAGNKRAGQDELITQEVNDRTEQRG